MYAEYRQSNERLTELRGARPLLDLDRRILENNLYGVDLNDEAVEICRLSLWIKTAHRGKPLTSLDHSIRVGNSVVSDPAVHPQAFDWQAAFPEVFQAGGFDVVVGNPPYIRQEWLDQFIDLGDTQVFADAKDVYPAIVVLSKRDKTRVGAERSVRTMRLRRNDVTGDLAELVQACGWDVPITRLNPEGWQFDAPEVVAIREKLLRGGRPLGEYVSGKVFRGLITGLNEAFVVDDSTRDQLVADNRDRRR
jgi:hypothetical protein